MTAAQTAEAMSPGLVKVAERARRDPHARFHSLAHWINPEALARAFRALRKDAAIGVDGITKEHYGQDLEARLRDLHERAERRLHLPNDDNYTSPRNRSPIGVARRG